MPLLGTNLGDWLPVPESDWKNWLASAMPGASRMVGLLSSSQHRGAFEILAHRLVDTLPDQVVLELIPTAPFTNQYNQHIATLDALAKSLQALHGCRSVDTFATESTQALQRFLGYDRVMLYRFDPDWSGVVIGEATSAQETPRFIGLHFPASDIPAQARELYTRNLLRVIADVQASSSALVSDASVADQLLDQSHCLLRHPSPMHLTYLGNMGVRATLTLSLMHQGKLWGMLACHHNQPCVPPDHQRQLTLVACELLATSLAGHIDTIKQVDTLTQQHHIDSQLDALTHSLRNSTSFALGWELVLNSLAALLGPVQVFACLHGQHFGKPLLSAHASADLASRLLAVPAGTPVATDHLAAWGWSKQDIVGDKKVAGLIAVSPEGTPDTYFLALRKPSIKAVRWGGQPDSHEPTTLPDGQVVLGPRHSFEVWLQTGSTHSQPWLDHEIYAFKQVGLLVARKHTKALLSKASARLSLFADSLDLLDDFVLITEAEPRPGEAHRRILYVNPAVCQHSGYSASELMGQSPSVFQGPGTDRPTLERISAQLKRWESVHETLLNYKKDGTPFWVDMKIMPVADAKGWYTQWISVQRDVTDTMALQASLAHEKDRLESVMAATGAGTWSLDYSTGRYTLDAEAAALFGFGPNDMGHIDIPALRALVHPQDLPEVIRSNETHQRGEAEFHDARFRIRQAKQGPWIWLRVRGRVTERTPDGTARKMIGTYTNVTEYVHTAQVAEQYRLELQSTLNAMPDGLLTLDFQGCILFARAPHDQLFGIDTAQLLGQQLTRLVREESCQTIISALQQTDMEGTAKAIEFEADVAGKTCYFESSIAKKQGLADDNGSRYVMTVRDISERKASEAKIAKLIYVDPLTGLLNRRALFDQLKKVHAISLAQTQTYSVLFVDLDNFKDLNDTHGHLRGDALLQEVAHRLTQAIRSQDVLARVGSDEFVVLMPDLAPGPQSALLAYNQAESLRAAVALPVALGGLTYQVSCSIGIAMGVALDTDVNQVIQRADIATNQAKAAGRNKCHFFDESLQKTFLAHTALERDLRHAVERGELRLFFQPIVTRERVVSGHEALIRWVHPTRGLVPPIDFIPLAEESDLILSVGQWVLKTACQQLATWANDPVRAPWFLAVNVSARQLQQADFFDTVREVLIRTQANPKRLKLELTESLLNTDLDATVQKMQQLRDLGVSFALDDFGTGYSSMSYIKRLPLNQLKIDRSFVTDLPGDQDAGAIATMIVQMADTLRMEVVAEGVETQAQVDYLHALGCQYFQGYFFGKPQAQPVDHISV
jgi:diguanylate cyclase (GGDEF)-like protein/PAS domain S-box-containing protein